MGINPGGHMSIRYQVCAAAMAISAGCVTPASAQAWIGQMVGNQIAAQVAAQQEAACVAGAPPALDSVTRVLKSAEKLMDAYFALTPKAREVSLSRVFGENQNDVRWRDSQGLVKLRDLGARLDEPEYDRQLVASTVGGDGRSLRAVWTVRPKGSGDGPATRVYAVDAEALDGGSLRIRRMTVSEGPDLPKPYGPFCHLPANED